MQTIPITLVQPCPPHQWAFAPTVGYYECMKCSERRDWNHPQYAEAEREYRAKPAAMNDARERLEAAIAEAEANFGQGPAEVEPNDLRTVLDALSEQAEAVEFYRRYKAGDLPFQQPTGPRWQR